MSYLKENGKSGVGCIDIGFSFERWLYSSLMGSNFVLPILCFICPSKNLFESVPVSTDPG